MKTPRVPHQPTWDFIRPFAVISDEGHEGYFTTFGRARAWSLHLREQGQKGRITVLKNRVLVWVLEPQEAGPMTLNRVITRVASRARIVRGALHPDDLLTLRLLGQVAGYLPPDPFCVVCGRDGQKCRCGT